jgi:hypothetical protein
LERGVADVGIGDVHILNGSKRVAPVNEVCSTCSHTIQREDKCVRIIGESLV